MSTEHRHRLQRMCDCPVCGKSRSALEMLSGRSVRPALIPFINTTAPNWTLDQDICLDCLNTARLEFVEQSLIREKGELTDSEIDVVNAIRNQELVSVEDPGQAKTPTFGDRTADKFVSIGGSWKFIIFFCAILAIWIVVNSVSLMSRVFDPYPYILLNLVLSCLAALQAPIIMMSQNRQEAKDRARAEADYKTNLKAELEIRHLHLKLDQLVSHQWHRLLEIQQIQLDMMNDIKTKNHK